MYPKKKKCLVTNKVLKFNASVSKISIGKDCTYNTGCPCLRGHEMALGTKVIAILRELWCMASQTRERFGGDSL